MLTQLSGKGIPSLKSQLISEYTISTVVQPFFPFLLPDPNSSLFSVLSFIRAFHLCFDLSFWYIDKDFFARE